VVYGNRVVMVTSSWSGDREEAAECIGPLREFGSPAADACAPKPYLAHQSMFDPSFVPGRWYFFKSCDVAELTDEIIDITVERSLRIDSPLTSFPIWQMGGAVGRVGDDETAFNGRSAKFTYNIGGCTQTSEGFDKVRDWVRSFWSALEPWHEGVYVKFLGDEVRSGFASPTAVRSTTVYEACSKNTTLRTSPGSTRTSRRTSRTRSISRHRRRGAAPRSP